MGNREGRDDLEQLPKTPAEQQESNHKKDVIRSDKNVVHAFKNKLPNDRADGLPGAEQIIDASFAKIEDLLSFEPLTFVEVGKSTVPRVVGKEPALQMDGPWNAWPCEVKTYPQVAFLDQRFDLAQFAVEPLPVRGDR